MASGTSWQWLVGAWLHAWYCAHTAPTPLTLPAALPPPQVRGKKRYVLLPPAACEHLFLLPRGDASARHSPVDWSKVLRPIDMQAAAVVDCCRA
jgi:hypothetical protein